MTASRRTNRLPGNCGIAIGPILFVIALMGLIAALISSNIGSYSSASVIDRIGMDVPSQANLIRTRINQCQLKLASLLAANNNAAGYQPQTYCTTTTACEADSSTLPGTSGNPTAVNVLTCNGAPLWDGLSYPNPTAGFAAWNYVSNTTGGRCIYTTPTMADPVNNTGINQGLILAAKKFSTQATCNNTTACTSEAIYDPASSSQKFTLWLAPPPAGTSPDPSCLP